VIGSYLISKPTHFGLLFICKTTVLYVISIHYLYAPNNPLILFIFRKLFIFWTKKGPKADLYAKINKSNFSIEMNDAMDVEIPLDPPLPKGEDLGLPIQFPPFGKGSIQFPPFGKGSIQFPPFGKGG
jgi:hypothetical protein